MSANDGAAEKVAILGVFVADTAYRAARQPRMGETLLAEGFALGPGGKGSNQAVAAARLGAEVAFLSRIGADAFGDIALRTWEQAGVLAAVTRDAESYTGAAYIFIDDATGDNAIIIAPGAAARISAADVEEKADLIRGANLETLMIILPYSVGLAVVGLLESMMTATIVDDLTDTTSDRNRECKGQGVANIGSSLLGGMAGCAMIGQSVINIKSGGRGRLSTFLAGAFLLIMVVFLGDLISQIPMAALVAVMIMVSIGTFSWESIVNLKHHPMSTNVVMLATVAIVVATHNLALGVFAGVLLASLFFANKIGRFMVVKNEPNEQGVTYNVVGQVFFASTEKFIDAFDFKEAVSQVTIDLTHAHFWDITAVGALDKVVIKFRREGASVDVIGMNDATATVVDKFGVHNRPEEAEKLLSGH